MRTTRLLAVLVALAAIAMVTADASAYYHPGMGRFMSRDPGAGGVHRLGAGGGPAATGRFIPRDPTGSNRYADGMNLYQYVRTQPTRYVDPSGLRILIHKGSQGTANRVSKAIQQLCPCFTYEPKRANGHFEVTIKTWNGKDAEGKAKVLPYNPEDEQAQKKFCKCYLPDKKTWQELGTIYGKWLALSDNDRRKYAEELNKALSGIKGNRGHMASCTLVAQAIRSNTVFWIVGKDKGPSTVDGTTINWNYTDRHWITGPISLGHELVHVTYGIGGGTKKEVQVVAYENAFRWEAGNSLRLDYAGAPVAQGGNPMLRWPQIDTCECPEQE